MLPTITCQVKQLLFLILLLKAHAQPPFASIQHQIKNVLQHSQHQYNSNNPQNKFYDKKSENEQQKNNLLALVDLTLLEEHPKELNEITGKNSSLPLITYGLQNLKYPVVKKFNSKSIEFLSKNKKNNNNFDIIADQYEINKNSKRYNNNQPISTSTLSIIPLPSELSLKLKRKSKDFHLKNFTSKQIIKQLKNSHQQQKREVILADVPFWPLQFATTTNSVASLPNNNNNNNNSQNYDDDIQSSSPLLDYTYSKPVKEPGEDENFSSKEISENEINEMLTPNEFLFLKEFEKSKRLSFPSLSSLASSSNSRFLPQLNNKPLNKMLIERQDDGGGGGGGGGDDGDNRSSGGGHKTIKFYLKSYPYQNKRIKVIKKFQSNPYNDVDDTEDYNGNNNYNDVNNYNIKSNMNNNNNRYSNDDNNIDEFRIVFNDKRITTPPVWIKMLRNRKDGRKPWPLADRKEEIERGDHISFFNDPDTKSYGMPGFKRQKFKIHQTQFVPSISVGAMTNLGDFFDNLKNNVDYMEKSHFNPDTLDLMEGDHLRKISEHIKAETAEDKIHNNENQIEIAGGGIEGGGGGIKSSGTAAFLHAIRTYRPSQKVRALVSMTPEGYHGHGQHFSDPNYMWMGLGK